MTTAYGNPLPMTMGGLRDDQDPAFLWKAGVAFRA